MANVVVVVLFLSLDVNVCVCVCVRARASACMRVSGMKHVCNRALHGTLYVCVMYVEPVYVRAWPTWM